MLARVQVVHSGSNAKVNLKGDNMLDITSCSEYAQKMYKSKKGYRDDSLFGEGYHNPKEVLIHEIIE